MSGGELTHEALKHFTGSQEFYSHWLLRSLIYTEGVKYVAETGHAYWLLDAIASHLVDDTYRTAVTDDPRIPQMHVWTLRKDFDNSARLSARVDAGEPEFVQQDIEYTDFPLEELDLWACKNELDGLTLMLPCEY